MYTSKYLGYEDADYTGIGQNVHYRRTWTVKNISVANGKTTFTVECVATGTAMSSQSFSITTESGATTSYNLSGGTGTHTKTLTVTGYTFQIKVKIGTYPPAGGIKDTTFTIDPLEGGTFFSAITLSGSFASGNLKAVSTLDKSMSGLTYSISYTIGSKTETNTNPSASTTKTFDSSWYSGLPTSTSGTLTVTGTVKDGGTVLQTLTKTLAVTIPDTVKPNVSAFAVAERLTTVPSSWGVYVQGMSAVKITTLTYTTPYSTASKISLKVGTATVKNGTPSNYPVSDVITQTGTVACTVTVTDARGRTGTRTVNITVYAYSAPSFNSALSERCDASGTADDEGTRFKVTTNVTYSSCGGHNTITLQVQSKPSTSSTYGTAQTIAPNTTVVTNATISPNASYDIRLTLKDAFNTAYHYDYISTALYLMHFKTGGNGIAFGQKATIDDTFDCNFAAAFRKGVTFTKSGGGTVTIDQIIDALGL